MQDISENVIYSYQYSKILKILTCNIIKIISGLKKLRSTNIESYFLTIYRRENSTEKIPQDKTFF